MSVVTYTAKRKIEEIAYAKSGTDISAAAADDSFNATSTSLAGLLNDEWIKVSGFANSANNGWFQANAASTANKITQDTSSVLVNEAAGPLIAIQGYKRGYGQSYSIEFTPRLLERKGSAVRKRQRAISGNSETLLQRLEAVWSLNTGRVLETQLAQWQEFLASVAAGEIFTFDPYGTIASPDAPISCELDEDDWSEGRIGTTRRYIIPMRFLEK